MDPFERLFATNAPLQALEIASVKGEIETRMAVIRKLELEVGRFQALLSPLRELPMEILGEVFAAVLASVKTPQDIPNALTALFLVCKTWRTAALETPRLWNTVGLTLRLGSTVFNFDKVKKWLARSGTLARVLILDSGLSCFNHFFDCVILNPGLVDFLKVGPPIHHLIVNSHTTGCFQRLVEALTSSKESPTPSWGSIKSIDLNSSNLELPSPAFQSNVPLKLTVTTLSLPEPLALPLSSHSSCFQFLFNNLTNLSIGFEWPTTWDQGILRLCANLQTLALNMGFEDTWVDENGDELTTFRPEGGPLILPCLRELRISDLPVETGWNLTILRLFNTPALVELNVSYDFDAAAGVERYQIGAEILSLLKRSQCEGTFSRLRIARLSIGAHSLECILQNLPGVKHLTLDDVNFDSAFFQRSGVREADFLPRLQVLEVLYPHEDFGYHSICEFIVSRHRSGLQLGKVRVELSSDWGKCPNETGSVMELRKIGIDAQIIVGTQKSWIIFENP